MKIKLVKHYEECHILKDVLGTILIIISLVVAGGVAFILVSTTW